MTNIFPELSRELDKILVTLAQNLDITKTQYDNLVKSYGAVGKYLEEDPCFGPFHPVITPQGSLRLGTIIQPVCEDDDLDVDLVYRLTEKSPTWTQHDIKQRVGDRFKSHGTYNDMLDKEEGRRCWTLLYRQKTENAKERYHMDVLPCVADRGHEERVRQMVASSFSANDVGSLAIRITDTKSVDYRTSPNKQTWLKSNPDGYAIWFASRCKMTAELREAAMGTIIPIGVYVPNKSILQRIVQLLKRHRDIMFNGNYDKPISIIITTLAARAYQGESSLFEGFCNVIDRMGNFIRKKNDGNYFIENPVNVQENFADKWPIHPKRRINFFKWLHRLKQDKEAMITHKGVELRDTFAASFGKNIALKTFADITQAHKENAANSKLKVASTGIIGSIGQSLNAKNTFFGDE